MLENLPVKSLKNLPFSKEPLLAWNANTDLLKYLVDIYDTSATITDFEGNTSPVNYSFYGLVLFETHRDRLLDLATDFLTKARKARSPIDFDRVIENGVKLVKKNAPQLEEISLETHGNEIIEKGLKVEHETVPEFTNDAHFGLVGKYVTAWHGIVSAVLSEGIYFSLAHVLEAASELECSILLASEFYYKQALQVLRGFLEHSVIQLYFCDNAEAFIKWKKNQYRTPTFRGKNGMLNYLVSHSILAPELAKQGSDLYGTLNGMIHGQENQFLNRGVFSGQHTNLAFKYERFKEWSGYFAQCVNFGIHALHINVSQWKNSNYTNDIYCRVCHNSENFQVHEESFAGMLLLRFICPKCHNEMTFDAAHFEITTDGKTS